MPLAFAVPLSCFILLIHHFTQPPRPNKNPRQGQLRYISSDTRHQDIRKPHSPPQDIHGTSTSPFDFVLINIYTSPMTELLATSFGQEIFTMSNVHLAGRPSRPRPPKPPQPRDGDSRYAYRVVRRSRPIYPGVDRSLCRGGGSGSGSNSGNGPQPRDDGKNRFSRSFMRGGDGRDPKEPQPRDPGRRRGRMSYEPQPRDPGGPRSFCSCEKVRCCLRKPVC